MVTRQILLTIDTEIGLNPGAQQVIRVNNASLPTLSDNFLIYCRFAIMSLNTHILTVLPELPESPFNQWDPKKIEDWRHEESVRRTKERRPDLPDGTEF